MLNTMIPAPPPGGAGGSLAQRLGAGVLALALLLLGLYTLWHFLSALAWACIFAIALWPLYTRVSHRLGTGGKNILLPAAFTLAVALVFMLPVVLAGLQLAHESNEINDWVHSVQQNGLSEPGFLRHLPAGQAQFDSWWQANLADPGGAKELVQRITQGRLVNASRQVGAQIAHRLTLFVFTLMTLFFLFRDGPTLTRQLRRAAIRAFGPSGGRVGQQIIASIHGTVNGLVLVGLGEGLVLGIVYAIAGVPQPTVFGAVTAVAAMVPFAALVVFTIAGLLLLAQGSLIAAIAVVSIGLAVTFTADHFIRPVLIGGATRLPFLWVLLGILGGVEVWGLIGLFIGPAIMAALMMLWREWAGEPAQPPALPRG